MARVALGSRTGPRVVLDARPGLCPGLQPADPGPVQLDGASDVLAGATVTVRRRLRTGWDDDGNPTFAWGDLVSGQVLGAETRRELDPVSGQARWSARVTVLYSGPALEDPTVEVVDDAGQHWQVTAVAQLPDRIALTMTRLDVPPTVEAE